MEAKILNAKDAVKRLLEHQNVKVAVAMDKTGSLQFIEGLQTNETRVLSCHSFDENLQLTNFNFFSKEEGETNRLILELVLTKDGFFDRGLATNSNNFAEFLIKDEDFDCIFGIFSPGSYGKNANKLSDKDYEAFATNFYLKNGYQIVPIDDFFKSPEKYPKLKKQDFLKDGFQYKHSKKDKPLTKIIAKDIKKVADNSKYNNINGVFVQSNVPEKVVEEIDSLQM